MMPPRPFTLVLLLALAAPLTAQAQPATAPADAGHVLVIRNGRIYLDGRRLPPQNLPPDLDLAGLPETTVNFTGPVKPVLEIDGVVYVLDGEHLKLLSETDSADAPVLFMPDATLPSAETEAPLMEAAEELYLGQVEARDRALYDRIQLEHDLEVETLRLAERIRATDDPAERARLLRSLREKLEASFDLKQDIRAEEIAQAEAQIEELRRLLRERGARKDQIIERRIEELTGGQ
jgi:hypothetical protein